MSAAEENARADKARAQTRSYTNRARIAIRDLPTLISDFAMSEPPYRKAQEENLREALNEAIGALVGIADTLKIEL